MKNGILIALCTMCVFSLNAQTMKQVIREGTKVLNEVGKGTNTNQNGNKGSLLSNTEIVSGLKEALKIGTQNASGKLNVLNGFFGNQLVKILLPPEVKKMEASMRQLGFGRQCDRLIMSLNRAAEDAAGKAVPIFVNAITTMNIQDGLNILRGGNNAATEFLKQNTTAALTQAFRPVIDNSLSKTGANTYWKEFFTLYNRLPISRVKVNADLSGYVTGRALNGLFLTVAQEEANIRNNPAAQVTNLLKKVFGNK